MTSGTLAALGIDAAGWDPAHSPDGRTPTGQGGEPRLRRERHRGSSRTKQRVAISVGTRRVSADRIRSARVGIQTRQLGKPFGDGRLTANGTFQKYYHPDELKEWVESTLGRTAITASPGIVYVFHEPGAAQQLPRPPHPRDQPGHAAALPNFFTISTATCSTRLQRSSRNTASSPSPTDLAAASEIVDIFGSVRGRISTSSAKPPARNVGATSTSAPAQEEHPTI